MAKCKKFSQGEQVRQHWLQLTLLCWFACSITAVVTDCNVCQSNGVACVSETSFQLCYEDSPDTIDTFSCNPGYVCTSRAVCELSTQPSCTLSSECGKCHAHAQFAFACQSRDTFQMCYEDKTPTGTVGNCPPGSVCHTSSDFICVPELQVQDITCNLETPTEPTANDWCALYDNTGVYSVNDPACREYVYCYRSIDGELQSRNNVCATGSYFDAERRMCTIAKPRDCL